MNLNSKDKETYWQERAEQRLINAENLTSDMLKNLKTTYEQTIKSIQKEINAFYGKYSTETGLDITEVRKRLDKSELKEFKKQLALYYDEVKRLGGYSSDTRSYLRELSAKAYISRLEELQANIRMEVENLYRQQQLRLFEVLSKGYEDTYYRANFDIQQGIGFAYSFTALNTKAVQKAVTQKWQGSNFSGRIWNDKVKLIDTLNQTIPQGIALGQNPRKVARNIAKTMETKFSNAERLARTEMNHICNDATRDAYKETPEVLQQYKVIATLDNRTSEICFVGTDKVQTVSDVEKLFKRNYTGKIITITTATGNQITGTPNHPVLTSEGWLPLDEINPNKHIIYSVLDDTIGIISKKNINVPTKLTELFNSFRKIARSKVLVSSTSTTKFNNNRTIRNGEINVLSTDRILRNWRQTIFNKHIIKNFFAFIHNSINLLCLRLMTQFFFIRKLVYVSPEIEIFTFSKFIEPTFRPIQLFNNLSWFKSIIKHINGSYSINIILAIMFAPLKMLHNSEFLKNICNSSSSSFILFCNFASGHTIPILADNVIDKSVKFANNCHVYNLQTKDNVYINNKIIVHNCQSQDNKVYKMSEWQEGVTAPPFHPNSSDKYTEIYTKDGWKLFKDCTDDDLYFSINPETMIPEWLKAVQRISYRFTGNLIEFTNTNFNKRVTPNHQMVMKYNKKDGANKLRFVTAEKCPKYNNSIPRGINWIGQDVKIAKLGNYEIPIDLYLKFMAWWLADGSCSQVSNNSYRGNIAQETHNKLMYETLQKMPFNISNSEDKLYFSDYSVCKELYQYGKCNEKYIPEFIKTLTPDLIKIFLEGYTITDGHKKKTKQWKGGEFKDEITFFTTSKKLADDLGELILKAGGRPSFKLQKNKGIPVKHHNGTYIGNFDVWVIRWCNNTWTNIESLQRNLIPYDDYVYCVELPKYHTLLIRRNGKVCWTGNCRSTTVPYFDDVDLSDYTRLATDYSTEQAYYVPANMSYKEWRASLTEKQDKAFIANKKAREQHADDKKQLAEYRKLQNRQPELFEGMPRTLAEYQAYKYGEPEKYEILKENAKIARSLK